MRKWWKSLDSTDKLLFLIFGPVVGSLIIMFTVFAWKVTFWLIGL